MWDYASEVAVVGGVMVNRRVGGDFFQPLSFEARRPRGEPTVDLYEQTFGKKPDLAPVLGSDSAVRALYRKGGKDGEQDDASRARWRMEAERAEEELSAAVRRAQAAAAAAEEAAATAQSQAR